MPRESTAVEIDLVEQGGTTTVPRPPRAGPAAVADHQGDDLWRRSVAPCRWDAARQVWGWLMFTIQGMPNRSMHMPNTSPHICFSKGIVTVPPSDSFCQ